MRGAGYPQIQSMSYPSPGGFGHSPMLVMDYLVEWSSSSLQRWGLHVFARKPNRDYADRMKLLGNAEKFPHSSHIKDARERSRQAGVDGGQED